MANFYTEYVGEDITPAWVADMGWQCMQDEWEFNRRAGWRDEDDDLPDVLKNEGVGPDNSMVFNVPKDVIDQAKQQRFEPRDELYTTKAAG